MIDVDSLAQALAEGMGLTVAKAMTVVAQETPEKPERALALFSKAMGNLAGMMGITVITTFTENGQPPHNAADAYDNFQRTLLHLIEHMVAERRPKDIAMAEKQVTEILKGAESVH